jgi:hypothetical protein
MKLSERVLQFHKGVRTVLIMGKQGAEWKMIEESIRPGARLLEETREQARAMLELAPVIMLGAAESIGGRAGNPEIAAVLYEKVGAIFVPLDPAIERIMCLTTERDAVEEVMHVIRNGLADIKKAT